MKKLILIAAVITALIPSALMAAGTVTQTLDRVRNSDTAILTFAWTADSSNGTVPSTTTSTEITAAIKGMGIIEVRTTPGTTGPTTLYDIVLNDADGLDLMGGALANRSDTAAEAVLPLMASGDTAARVVDSAITMVLTNNSINSATGTVKIYLRR